MYKRALYAEHEVITHQEEVSGYPLVIDGTVNDKFDMLRVGGDSWQLKQEQGKNLFDMRTVLNENGKIDSNFGSSGEISINRFDVVEGKQYLLITKGTRKSESYSSVYFGEDDINYFDKSTLILTTGAGYVAFVNDVEKRYIYTATKTCTITKCIVHGIVFRKDEYTAEEFGLFEYNGEDINSIPYEPFQPQMPSPEYPSEIKSAGGELVSHGWNLWDKGNVAGRTAVAVNYNTLLKAGNYIVSVKTKTSVPDTITTTMLVTVALVNGKSKWFNAKSNDRSSHVLSFEEDCVVNKLVFYAGNNWVSSDGYDFSFSDIQICKEDKSYDRYRGNSITLPELRAIRDDSGNIVAQDWFCVDRKAKRAWVERNIGIEHVTRNTGSWNKSHVETAYWAIFSKAVSYSKLISNRFIHNESKYWKGECGYMLHDTSLCFSVDDGLTDIDMFLNWLDENETIVEYVIAEPYTEELPWSDDYLLGTCQYQTNVRFTDIDEHLQPTIEGTVKKLGRA